MPSAKKKSSKPTTCSECGGVDLVRKITTYPVLLSGPLEGKQVHVGRVALHECLTCGHLMPTPAGQAKSPTTMTKRALVRPPHKVGAVTSSLCCPSYRKVL